MTFPLRIRLIVVLALIASAGPFALADETGFSTPTEWKRGFRSGRRETFCPVRYQ